MIFCFCTSLVEFYWTWIAENRWNVRARCDVGSYNFDRFWKSVESDGRQEQRSNKRQNRQGMYRTNLFQIFFNDCRIAAVSCSPDGYMLGGVKMGIWWWASRAVHGIGAWVVHGCIDLGYYLGGWGLVLDELKELDQWDNESVRWKRMKNFTLRAVIFTYCKLLR